MRCGVPDDEIVLVDDEHVPLVLHALGVVVVGQGCFRPLRAVPLDGGVNEGPGKCGRPDREIVGKQGDWNPTVDEWGASLLFQLIDHIQRP